MQAILQHIFSKNSLHDVPLADLQQLVLEHPFFAPAQYLLAAKLYQTGDEAFGKQIEKTAVYFNNPLWLEHLILNPQQEQAQSVQEPEPVLIQVEESLPVAEPEKESIPGSQSLLRNLQHNTDQTGTLEFQAYHTIDYFASQGIRLPATDDQSGDKLGKQLKSFTEWLKTMRRLPEAAQLTMEKVHEEAIYQQASSSLEEKEVVTEAMAEVLVKQHNKGKAMDIYHKLGLLHPSKKTYFAAKIEALKY